MRFQPLVGFKELLDFPQLMRMSVSYVVVAFKSGIIHKHQLKEIQEFFETYKRLEPHKWAKAKEWKNAKEAMKIVNYAMKKYRELSGKEKTE